MHQVPIVTNIPIEKQVKPLAIKTANNTKEGHEHRSGFSVNKDTNDTNSQLRTRLENLLRSKHVIDQIHDAVIATDLNGSIIAWNKGAEHQLGYTSNEVLDHSIYSLYPEERHGYLTSDVLDILQVKGNFEIETTMRTKSGEIFFAHSSISPLADETGEVIGIISYSLDITARKKIEQSLKESEERLKLAIAGGGSGIWDWDIHTNNVFYSSRFKELIGYTEEEEFPDILNSFVDHLHPDDYEDALNAINNHLDNRVPYDVEYRLRTKSGEYCWFRARGQALWDENGKATRMSGSIRDIDEKKKTEIELAHYQNKLEELVTDRTNDLAMAREGLLKSNLSLKVLSQSNHTLIHATDEQKLLEEICQIIVETGNFSMAWICYALHDEYKSILPIATYGCEKDYVESLNLTWADVELGRRPTGTAIRTATPVMLTNTLKDPRFKHWRDHAIEFDICSIVALPLLDKDNTAFGALTICSTEIDYFSEEEIGLLTELANNVTYGIMAIRTKKELFQKERLATLGQIIATVSHELRNPLGTIRTSLYTISQKLTGKNKSLLEKQITRAERNVMRCDSIIEELLSFTRSSDLHLEETLLDDWCNEAINEYAFPENIEISKNFSSGATTKIDKEKIRRCLINIINNACQAMIQSENNEETRPLKLSIYTGYSDTNAWVEINDTGPGIPDKDIDKIFEPLYSTKTYGIGLGLPIVKQIMEQHSGGISIGNHSTEGAFVKLWFPLYTE